MQALASAFLAFLFLQSGIDKIVDRQGNLDWLKGHFATSPLAGMVLLMFGTLTLIELAAEGIERERRLPVELVNALLDAGLFSMLLPASLGGAEGDIPTFARAVAIAVLFALVGAPFRYGLHPFAARFGLVPAVAASAVTYVVLYIVTYAVLLTTRPTVRSISAVPPSRLPQQCRLTGKSWRIAARAIRLKPGSSAPRWRSSTRRSMPHCRLTFQRTGSLV